MKLLKQLKDIEKGNDIYVLASGPSMDFIPKSFFENKVTLGINELYVTHKCKYYIRKEHKEVFDALKHPGIHIISRHDCGNWGGSRAEDNDDCYIFDHMSNDESIHIEELDTDRIIVSWSTITSGIHMAYYLGAKNIILCGADCGRIDGRNNVKNYHTGEGGGGKKVDQEWYRQWLGNISPASELLAAEIRKRGVPVMSINPFINYQLEGHLYDGMRQYAVKEQADNN